MCKYIKNSRRCGTCKYFKKQKACGKGMPKGVCKYDESNIVEVTPLHVNCDNWERPRTVANRDAKKCGTCIHFTETEPECAFHVVCTYRTVSCCEYVKKEKEKTK